MISGNPKSGSGVKLWQSKGGKESISIYCSESINKTTSIKAHEILADDFLSMMIQRICDFLRFNGAIQFNRHFLVRC